MSIAFGEYPEFSWSYSKHQTLRRCRRAYYFSTYLKWRGWERGAPSSARNAWICSKLTTLPLALGDVVHKAARQCAQAAIEGSRSPTTKELRERAGAQLNAIYYASKYCRQTFLAAPTSTPMLGEFFYNSVPSAQRIGRARARLDACLEALVDCTVFDELRSCDRSNIVVVDAVQSFRFQDVIVYAAPDLLFRPGTDNREPWQIVDWKTGGGRGVADQLSIYCLLARDGLFLPIGDGYTCRCIFLAIRDTVGFVVADDELRHATEQIRASVAEMRSMLSDPVRNVPASVEQFVPTPSAACAYCNFRGICKEGRAFISDGASVDSD